LSTIIEVDEYGNGLNTSVDYYFVIDGNRVVHISKYAISIYRERYGVRYKVDLNMLRGKTVIRIMGSKSSGLYNEIYMLPAEDLGKENKEWIRRPLSYLNNLEFTYLTQEDREFLLSDWTHYYFPMLQQLRKLLTITENYNTFILPQPLLHRQIKSGADYPLSFLVPDSYSRRNSLKMLTKQIHQIWLLSRIIAELIINKVIKDFERPFVGNYKIVSFKQSSSYSVATFSCSCGNCSIWHEFDIHPVTMFDGAGWQRVEPPSSLKEFYERDLKISKSKKHSLRPDIVILCGVNSYEDFYKVDKVRVRVLIECKNQDIQYWSKDIIDQIIPYKQIFQSDITIVASLKKVPESVKAKLNQQGIKVIDEVYPEGKGEKELLEVIKSA